MILLGISRPANRRSSLEAVKKYTAVQGEVVYAASLLHEQFYHLFRLALSMERPDKYGADEASLVFSNHAQVIWHTVQSDNIQRKMALSAVSSVPTKLKLAPAIARLRWAKNKTEKMAEYRNLMAHTPVMFRVRKDGKRYRLVPSFGGHATRPTFAKRLEMLEGISFWRTLRNDFLHLTDYVGAVVLQIQRMDAESSGAQLVGVPHAWPGRPRLPSLIRLQEIEKKLAPEPRKSKRRTRRLSSRA